MTPTDVERMLADRYGRASGGRRRRAGWIVVGAAAVALTGLFGWWTVSASLGSAEGETTGYEIVDEHAVTVRFSLSVAPGSPAACAVEAQDPEHGIVGWKVVEIAASDQRDRGFTVSVPTIAAATTGLIRSCWIL